jgi:hypothetical protein
MLLAVEMDTPCTSILLAVESQRHTPCILHVHTPACGNGYTLHVHIAGCGKGYTLYSTSILLAVEGDTPCTYILLAL